MYEMIMNFKIVSYQLTKADNATGSLANNGLPLREGRVVSIKLVIHMLRNILK